VNSVNIPIDAASEKVNNVNIPRKQYHHGNLRQALIKAGLRAVAEDGPEGFSLRGVATRAGVTAPAVYRHFKDKDELLAAIAAECNERLSAVVAESLARADDVNALGRFRHIGIAYVQFAVANPEHFRALTMPGVLAKLPPEQRAEMESWHVEQRRGLELAQQAGVIANIPIDELMLAANSLVHGLAHLIVEGQLGDVDEARARDLAIAVTGAFGHGLIPRDTAPDDSMRPTASNAATPSSRSSRKR
jgi:AcrR family transcriptional regulator